MLDGKQNDHLEDEEQDMMLTILQCARQSDTGRHAPCKMQLKMSLRNTDSGAGEMTEWLREMTALSEDLGLIPGTHTMANKLL